MNEIGLAPSRYPLGRHALCLLPLLLLVTALFLAVGGESEIAGYFHRLRQGLPGPTAAILWLSEYGNVPFYAGYTLLLAHALRTRRTSTSRFVLHYLVMLGLLLLVADIMKIWIGRPRPYVEGEFVALSLKKAWHSFPSNHMTETVFTVMSLALFLRRAPVTVAGAVWIAAMGFTRIYLGRHHPTDLLGSAVVAGVAVYALWKLTARCSSCPVCALLPSGGKETAPDYAIIS